MNSPKTPPHDHREVKSRRRWLRFGLRSLLVLMSVIAITFAFVLDAVRRDERAIAAIEAVDGEVFRDPSATGKYLRYVLPESLSDQLSSSWFNTVKHVDFSQSDATDVSMLEDLPAIKYLCLQCTDVTDFAPITKLQNLRSISFECTLVNDLSPLVHCPKLEQVYLCYIRSDRKSLNLEPLSHLKKLERLDLSTAPVSDISVLSECRSLRRLSIRRTNVRSIEPLRGMQNLKHLEIDDLELDDLDVLLTLKLDELEIDAADVDDSFRQKLTAIHKRIYWRDED